MANGNPFYVPPVLSTRGGQQAIAGLGGFIREQREESKARESAQMAQQDFLQAFQSGTAEDVAAFSVKNPQLAQSLMQNIQFRDDATRQNLTDSMRQIAAGADPEQVIQQRASMVAQRGGDPAQTMQEAQMLQQLGKEGYRDYVTKLYAATDPKGFKSLRSTTGAAQDQTAGQREFSSLADTAGLSEDDRRQAARIELGLDPRATGSAQQTIASQGTAQSVAEVAKVVEGGKEQGKLMAKLQLQPEIKTAVQTATLEAQSEAKALSNQKSNDSSWRVYQTGLANLTEQLGETVTGPVSGLLPALTSSAQAADGAVAIMAPLLKQAFRSSGEGTFTDKDQQLLLAMVPTRSDLPEARKSKLEAIDSIMRAKLQQPEQGSPAQPEQGAARTEADILSQYGIN